MNKNTNHPEPFYIAENGIQFQDFTPDHFDAFSPADLESFYRVDTGVNLKRGYLMVMVKYDLHYLGNKVFHYDCSVEYYLKNLSDFVTMEDGRPKYEDEFLTMVLRETIAIMRGMVALRLTGKFAGRHPIPSPDYPQLIKEMREQADKRASKNSKS